MAIARTPVFVYDCPDPHALAEFYRGLLGGTIDEESDDHWVDLLVDAGGCISFQQVEDYRAPKWPGQEVPQQLHLDVDVDDLDLAEAAVLQLGAVNTRSSRANADRSGCFWIRRVTHSVCVRPLARISRRVA